MRQRSGPPLLLPTGADSFWGIYGFLGITTPFRDSLYGILQYHASVPGTYGSIQLYSIDPSTLEVTLHNIVTLDPIDKPTSPTNFYQIAALTNTVAVAFASVDGYIGFVVVTRSGDSISIGHFNRMNFWDASFDFGFGFQSCIRVSDTRFAVSFYETNFNVGNENPRIGIFTVGGDNVTLTANTLPAIDPFYLNGQTPIVSPITLHDFPDTVAQIGPVGNEKLIGIGYPPGIFVYDYDLINGVTAEHGPFALPTVPGEGSLTALWGVSIRGTDTFILKGTAAPNYFGSLNIYPCRWNGASVDISTPTIMDMGIPYYYLRFAGGAGNDDGDTSGATDEVMMVLNPNLISGSTHLGGTSYTPPGTDPLTILAPGTVSADHAAPTVALQTVGAHPGKLAIVGAFGYVQVLKFPNTPGDYGWLKFQFPNIQNPVFEEFTSPVPGTYELVDSKGEFLMDMQASTSTGYVIANLLTGIEVGESLRGASIDGGTLSIVGSGDVPGSPWCLSKDGTHAFMMSDGPFSGRHRQIYNVDLGGNSSTLVFDYNALGLFTGVILYSLAVDHTNGHLYVACNRDDLTLGFGIYIDAFDTASGTLLHSVQMWSSETGVGLDGTNASEGNIDDGFKRPSRVLIAGDNGTVYFTASDSDEGFQSGYLPNDAVWVVSIASDTHSGHYAFRTGDGLPIVGMDVLSSVIPPLRQRQRDDGLAGNGPRVASPGRNTPTSRQGSLRQGEKNTYL